MYTMTKPTLFLVLMSVCTASMAQESDTCEILTEARVMAQFDNTRWGKTAMDTSFYHHFFYVPNKTTLQEMGEWARQQGFEVLEKVIDEKGGEQSHMIMLEKQMMHNGGQQMMQEIRSIVTKRRDLGIFVCNGSGLGGGKSFMVSAKTAK